MEENHQTCCSLYLGSDRPSQPHPSSSQLALLAASFLGSSAPCLASLALGLPASPSQLHAVTLQGGGGGSFRGIPQFCHILPDFSDFLEQRYKLPWPCNLHSWKPHTLWSTLPSSVASLKRALAPFILPLLWPLCAWLLNLGKHFLSQLFSARSPVSVILSSGSLLLN